MAVSSFALQVNGSVHKHPSLHNSDNQRISFSSTFKPFFKELQQLPMKVDVAKTIKNATKRLLDAFVDSTFQFIDQPLLPSQSNFAPVEEIGEAVEVTSIEGKIPADFPEGVYIRNGPNPLFGGLKSTVSIFGRSSHVWIEGEGMLHAVYFKKNADGQWTISYNNKHVESKTFKLEQRRNKPSFLPAVEGDSSAILAAFILNALRFGTVYKHLSNTSVFEHSGKCYAIAENYIPQEIDISTLETFDDWDINGAWNRPFTSHPKKDPHSGELVTMGIDAKKPYYVVGVISADGEKLSHKVDLKFNRSVVSHEIGVTEKYNVIMDYALTADLKRVIIGGQLLKYDKEDYARIGVMPRYGNADSVRWFAVESHCTFHIINSFEDGNEVVVRGCRALASVIPGPDMGLNKFEWFSRGFKFVEPVGENTDGSTEDGYLFSRVYEWRLNMVTDEVKERNLTGIDFSMDFPLINGDFTGLNHKNGYTQVVDSMASTGCGQAKYGGLAKLYFDEYQYTPSVREGKCEQLIKVEYHKFAENIFCTGSAFVSKQGGVKEDDGWIVTFVHNEGTNVSQAYIIDAKKFESEPVAIITLPQRVPYGFHGNFVTMPKQA